jgi:hypothetical protein
LLGKDSPAERERFERGLREVLKLQGATMSADARAELERYLANPIRAAAQDMRQSWDEITELLDAHRGGRKPGAISDQTKHIRKLVADHPGLSAKELRKHADESVLDGMKPRAFDNQVSAARRK